MTPQACRIQDALGKLEPCPGEPCPFWEGKRCLVAGLRVDLGRTPGLPDFLLRIRNELGAAGATTFGLLPPDHPEPTT
jgi:hypothetical protein